MPHDECIRVQVLADETYSGPVFGPRNIFRFWAEDGNGKPIVSNAYEADSMTNMYTFAEAPLEWITHDEVKAYRKTVKKALHARPV